MEKKYTIICLTKKYKFFVRLKSVNIIMTKIVFQLLFNCVCYDLVMRIIIINKIVF